MSETSSAYPYETRLDIAFHPLEVVDVQKIVDATTHPWFNQTLCAVNESVVRLGIVQGEYHWHKHEGDRTVALQPRQGFVVPKGVKHRPRAPKKTIILMVEGAGIVPTGD